MNGASPEVNYVISTRKSKFMGYQEKSGLQGTIKLFVTNIYKEHEECGESFVDLLMLYMLIERFCIERAFQGIRMHQRCKPECKMAPYAMFAFMYLFRGEMK